MARKTSSRAPRAPQRVHVLALAACTPFVPVGVAELLRKSLELAATLPLASRARQGFEVRLVSGGASRDVVGAGGLRLRCDATLADAGPCELVVAPALDPDVLEKLSANAAAVAWLRRAYRAGADVASACTGSFLLAEAGLLAGRAATTHWAFQPLFAARYPDVRLEPQAVLVDQGRVVTAGGATSFINLALLLVERLLGPEAARAASKMFLIDPNKSPQGAYAIFGTQKAHGDAGILRAQSLIERDYERSVGVPELARTARMSQRSLARHFVRATGNTPREYLQRVRVEAAKRELETRHASVADVASAVGYDDVTAFRKVFQRVVGLTPSDYRLRYGVTAN